MSVSDSNKLLVGCVLLGLGAWGLAGCSGTTLGDGLPDEIGCSTCHGSELNPAPPVSVDGSIDSTVRSVGAHQAHLLDGELRKAVGCAECHVVPTAVGQAGHVDPLPAEVVFGSLATRQGLRPTWDRESATCRNTYCHGATLSGGNNKVPEWTTVNGSQDACGTCHGVPPPLPHPQSADCNLCHPTTVDVTGGIIAGGGKHIDGVLDAPVADCTLCHGDQDSPAPPLDTSGNSENSTRGVGAHRQHLADSTWHAPVACGECHTVPAEVSDPGHNDTLLPAELVWGPLASADGARPAWNPSALTCSGTYCHGSTLHPGGTLTEPVWTTVDGTQVACGTCHGLPPGPPHLNQTACETCHDQVVAADGSFIAPRRHIDGIVDVSGGACGSCHPVPPTPQNEQYPGSGGAHELHAGTLGYSCATCHGHNGTGPQHDQGNGTVLRANVDIVFDPAVVFPGGTTMENGGVPAEIYNSGNPTCWVGCHNPLPGDLPDLDNPAVWTDASISCADCHEQPGTGPDISHDLDPDAPDDPTISAGCRECHDTSGHTLGTVAIVDPDPGDADSFAGTGTSGLCRTCHDGGPGTFFAGQTPADQSDYWNTPTAHDGLGLDCDFCHDHHGRSSGTALVNREEDLCAFCHGPVVAEMNDAGTPTHHHIVDGEQSGPSPLECTSCHDPHKVQKNPWRPVTDPVSKALFPAGDVPHDSGDDPSAAFSDNARFCLTCHNGSWPGALNLAAELADKETLVTSFRKGTENLHFVHSEKLNAPGTQMPCTYCHNAHANTGTSGTNRRALLYDWITVNRFPYQGKSSCSTGDALGQCH